METKLEPGPQSPKDYNISTTYHIVQISAYLNVMFFFMELGFIFDYIKDDIRSSHRLQEEPGSLACQCDFKYQKKSGTYYIKNLYLRRRHVVSFVYSSEELGGRFE